MVIYNNKIFIAIFLFLLIVKNKKNKLKLIQQHFLDFFFLLA